MTGSVVGIKQEIHKILGYGQKMRVNVRNYEDVLEYTHMGRRYRCTTGMPIVIMEQSTASHWSAGTVEQPMA